MMESPIAMGVSQTTDYAFNSGREKARFFACFGRISGKLGGQTGKMEQNSAFSHKFHLFKVPNQAQTTLLFCKNI
jgi:hypothetical protein